MEEKNKGPRDPVERIERGLMGNFGKGSAELKLQYEGVSNNQNAAQECQAFLKRLGRAYCKRIPAGIVPLAFRRPDQDGACRKDAPGREASQCT